MTLSDQKAQFSVAFFQAVASAACCKIAEPKVDDDSVDVKVEKKMSGSVSNSPELNVQLKATAQDVLLETEIAFPLKIKNYDELRDEKVYVPRILVVFIMPEHPSEWLKQAEFKAHLYRCAYWVSLKGLPPTANAETVTVRVPRKNVLTPDALNALMTLISNGGRP